MPINNSSNLFATTPYIVSAIASQGSYTTIQAAITAASTAGGGVVYVKPGTYFENLSIANNVTLAGTNVGIDGVSLGVSNTIIFGNHTFPAGASVTSIANLTFGCPASGSSPIFTVAPSTGQSSISFSQCVLDDTLGSGTPTSTISSAPTGSGNVLLQITDSVLTAGAINLSLGANSTANVSYCSINDVSGTTPCVLLSSATAILNSSYNSYNSDVFASIRFTANGLVTSLYDSFNSQDPSGFYISSSGSFGRFAFADAIAISTATGIDPQITKTLYSQLPDVYPTTNGQVVIGRTGNTPVATTLTAGTGVSITNGSGIISIATSVAPVTWNIINVSLTMTSNNGYIVISGIGSNLTLPTTSAVGDRLIIVANDVATIFSIRQAAGQRVRFGSFLSTTGTGGSITSVDDGASLTLVCTTANTNWSVYDSLGNFTII
jgi:hypothetical protein